MINYRVKSSYQPKSSAQSKQAVTPAADSTRTPQPKLSQAQNSTTASTREDLSQQASLCDLPRLIRQSFLSLYLQQPQTWQQCHDEALFEFPEARLHVLLNKQQTPVASKQVKKNLIKQLRNQAVNDLIKRQQQLLRSSTERATKSLHKPTYYLGVTGIIISHDDKPYLINHSFGSEFFLEECVLDLDDANQILQILSWHDFVQVLKTLISPRDFMVWMNHHRQYLIEQMPFYNEMQLLHRFLQGRDLFITAYEVEQQLLQTKLLNKVDQHLQQFYQHSTDSENRKQALKTMRDHAEIWERLLHGYNVKQQKQHQFSPLAVLRLGVDESIYSRYILVREILAYGQVDAKTRQQGYVVHQHSRSEFGRHYVLLFYGVSASGRLSRQRIDGQQDRVLIDINSQLQNPVMKDILLLCFDMSQQVDANSVNIDMQVFHMQGTKMTTMERRLYDEINRLRAQL